MKSDEKAEIESTALWIKIVFQIILPVAAVTVLVIVICHKCYNVKDKRKDEDAKKIELTEDQSINPMP